jgi:hypothetical protein
VSDRLTKEAGGMRLRVAEVGTSNLLEVTSA